MSHGLVTASSHGGDHLSRAADHAGAIGVALLIVVVAGLVYGLVRLVGKSRAGRTRSDRAAEADRGPEA